MPRPNQRKWDQRYCSTHKEQIHVRDLNYYAKNREKIKSRNLKYALTLNGRFSVYKSQAKRLGRTFELTLEQFQAITEELCYYCGKFSISKDHCGIDRVDTKIGYVLSNCVPCCEQCNKMKMDYSEHEFLGKCLEIVMYRISLPKPL